MMLMSAHHRHVGTGLIAQICLQATAVHAQVDTQEQTATKISMSAQPCHAVMVGRARIQQPLHPQWVRTSAYALLALLAGPVKSTSMSAFQDRASMEVRAWMAQRSSAAYAQPDGRATLVQIISMTAVRTRASIRVRV